MISEIPIVEISIDQQTMWCYVDGQLLVETPVVTDVYRTETETPRGGVWKVKGKRTDYTMRGAINPDTGEPSVSAVCQLLDSVQRGHDDRSS